MSISIITATFNSSKTLPLLIESLKGQIDKDFEWIISDGASNDETLEVLNNISGLNIKISSQHDFGIYDAINRAIRISTYDYYLVVGSDDILAPEAVKVFKEAILSKPVDIVVANISMGANKITPKNLPSWYCGQFAYISGHSVGTLIKKDLHSKYGLYSKKYPIAADQLFILKACMDGVEIQYINKIVGEFGDMGVSSVDTLGMMTEYLRVQIEVGHNKTIQLLLFAARIIKKILI
ncbi:glycosyltransferase [Halobacteriovorax sp. YZS-1-1]|uniref:glycosyltransferase n=1 Tax=unclassified Halobacteriovorax TaxID=2639665 RepID=UPI00399C198B